MAIVTTIPSRRCSGEHRRRGRVIFARSRWECSKLSVASGHPRFNGKRRDSSSGEERLQHSFSSSLSLISLTSAHTLTQVFFFFWRQEASVAQRKKFPAVWLTAQRMRDWGFDASNPSWFKHRLQTRECSDAPWPVPPLFFFFYSTTRNPLPSSCVNNDCSKMNCRRHGEA